MRHLSKSLEVGDAIRTNPREGYWGCAVVLSNFPATPDTEPRCHIGITPILFRHAFSWKEIDLRELRILDFEVHYHPKPGVMLRKTETCIRLYQNINVPALEILQSVCAQDIYPSPLSSTIGRGEGKFAFAGRVDGDLGLQAVIAWRRVNDREALEAESAASLAEWFASEENRRTVAREKARVPRNRGT